MSILSHYDNLFTSIDNFRLWNLNRDTPIFGRALEISRGFASVFTPDEYLQNFIGAILSPILVLGIFALMIWIMYRLMQKYQRTENIEILQGQQLLLFKTKQLGITEYQYKILKGITDILHLEKPAEILKDPLLFERSIIRFLSFAFRMGENRESFESICRDLIITYEKIYHFVDIRKPLAELRELEVNTLIGLETLNGRFFIAKIRSQTREGFAIRIFAMAKDLEMFIPGTDLRVFLWRAGDAEYEFRSVVISNDNGDTVVQLPNDFTRGRSVPHPLVDVIVPCSVSTKPIPGTVPGQQETFNADIFRLNESEAIIRCSAKLDHAQHYILGFTVNDFAVRADIQILRERFISDRKIYYFNVKFTDISDAGKTVIGNYIINHLFPDSVSR